MTAITPAPDLSRFLTADTLRQIRERRPAAEPLPRPAPVPPPQPPDGSPLSAAQAAALRDRDWRKAFQQSSSVLLTVLEDCRQTDDGREISAQLLDRLLDLHSYGMALFASADPDPKKKYREKAHETLDTLWQGIKSTVETALEEAEPILRAEYQEQVDAYLSMIDHANAETTTERRRADAAEVAVGQLRAQHLNDLDTAVWRSGQAAKTELKTMQRRAEYAEHKVEGTQHELALLRQEVARQAGLLRDQDEAKAALERQLSVAQGSLLASFQKDAKKVEVVNMGGELKVASVLTGLTMVCKIRRDGYDAVFNPETRTVSSGYFSSQALENCAADLRLIPNHMAYLRAHLVAAGLVGA